MIGIINDYAKSVLQHLRIGFDLKDFLEFFRVSQLKINTYEIKR